LADSFTNPFPLGKRLTLPARFQQVDSHSFKVILKEGINRHIRRICAKNQNQVKQLIRIRFGNHELGELKAGECREVEAF
jgi:23S rRNA pseudouridine2604 synthase